MLLFVRLKVEKKQMWFFGLLAFWYISLFPGRIGYDYVKLAEMIRNGESTAWWGATYFWFYKLLTFNARTIFIISLLGLLILYHSIRYFIFSLPVSSEIKHSSLVLITASPLFGVFGVTVNHDVLQSAGVILLVSVSIRLYLNTETEKSVQKIILLSGIYLTSTQIGLVIFGVFLSRFVIKRKFWSILFLMSTVILSFTANIGIEAKGSAKEFIPGTFRNLMLVDLKCIVQHPDVMLNQSDWQTLEFYAPKNAWLEETSCSNPDVLAAPLELSKVDRGVTPELLKLFTKLVLDEPAIPIMSHIQRSRVALPPPFFQPPTNQVELDVDVPIGKGTNTALQSGPGILHISIDDPIYDQRPKFLKPLEALALLPAFIFNQSSWFWSWGGLWLWPLLIFLIRSCKVRTRDLLLISLPILTLHTLLFLIGPSSLGRYVMASIYMGVIATFIQLSAFFSQAKH